MLFIKSLTIDRLKSFSHAELLFNKGFTCVVGPNGSGKSTICDALLLGLGEKSLKRLRADRLDDLIRSTGKKAKSGELKMAHVKLEFSGETNISVTRYVRSDGKSRYKVNGRTMKRHEVLELLGHYGIHAEETNTIAQGEINMLSQMSAVELRELIDSASGIKEFEYKKGESLRELDKVNQKIGESRVMLSERSGFLGELAAEKESAEKYIGMTARLRSLTYSILVAKKGSAEDSLKEYVKSLAAIETKSNALSLRLQEINAQLDKLNAERHVLTKQLSDSTENIGSTKAKLESTNIRIAKLDAELSALGSAILDCRKEITATDTELSVKRSAVEANTVKIGELGKRLAPLEQLVKSSKAKVEELNANPEKIKELGAAVDDLEKRLSAKSGEMSRLAAELSILKNRIESKAAELESVKELLEKKNAESAQYDRAYQNANMKRGELSDKTRTVDVELQKINARVNTIDEKLIELREKKAYAQPRSQALAEKLALRFGRGSGFHGTVSELCTYKAEHAYAIESAAGSRFDYFVVDDINAANSMIRYMKENGLGRATFIPVNDLVYRQDQRERSLTHVLDLVRFEAQYDRVFSYVFGNTYLIERVDDAKRHGVGKRRYVTVEGDIVEQAGIVSGGSASRKLSMTSINAQLQGLTDEKAELRSAYERVSRELDAARKGETYAEIEINSVKNKLNVASVESASCKKSIGEISKVIGEYAVRETALSEALKKAESERIKVEEKLEETKKQLDRIVTETVEMTKRMASKGATEEEIRRTEAAMKELEGLRIGMAEMGKENKMLDARIQELAQHDKERKSALREMEGNVKSKQDEKDGLASTRKEIELSISDTNGESKKIFSRMGELDKELDKFGNEKGKLSAELGSYERNASDTRIRKVQTETTLNDLTADLSVYKESVEIVNASVQEMERESAVLNSKIKDLGNVNLRAPELYADKAKDVEEAKSKVETLETEQQAIRRMIEEIDSKKLQTFMSTFNDVVVNFKKFCGYVFTEEPYIGLTNQKDPFKSGLDISIMEGKTRKHLSKLSGGEKSFVLLVLIFSIHMCKPASLYIFDEVDTALDKDNSKKLSLLIKQMSSTAQFVVVSHNDSLITNADAAIGVVKVGGESKAVGLEIAGIRKQ